MSQVFGTAAPGRDDERMRRLWQTALRLHQAGQLQQAEPLYRQLLDYAPAEPGLLQSLATLRLQQGAAEEALALFDRALALRDDASPELWNNRGTALKLLGRLPEALAAHERALALAPDYLPALGNRAAVLGDLQRLDEALRDVDRVLLALPERADQHNNRGVLLQDLRRFDEALAAYAKAISLAPDYADAHWNEARCRLLLGDYEGGWARYEWRWQREDFSSPRRNFKSPLWDGSDLRGRTILLHAEQGLGDTLQFLRYVPLVLVRGGRVVLEVQRPLLPLAQRIAGVTVLAAGDRLPPFAVHCPLLSLPWLLRSRLDTLPAAPYLRADEGKCAEWAQRLGAPRALRVGLMWSGNPAQKDNHLRSLPLRDLLCLALPGVELISLQKDLANDEERAIVASGQVRHFGASMDDTAALMCNVDVVVSVCTSMAHLAGALGCPMWVLLQSAADWRWLLDRDDSPWYPSARLFRQQQAGDWSGVLAAVQAALAGRL